MTLPYSKPPHCRTGHSRGDRYSPAWDKADDIVALYRAKDGHKTIAKRLGISPRIAREILIERGEWKPGSLKNSQHYRDKMREIGNASAEEKSRIALAKIPAWKKEEYKRAKTRKGKRGQTKYSDLPLFNVVVKKKQTIRCRERFSKRYKEDHTYRLLHCLRKRWNKVVKRGRGYGGSVLAWLGCTAEEFIEHLRQQYEYGMHDGNYGCGEGQWSIDHIRPCASFDLTDEEQRLACFHYSNARPMWHIDNVLKSDTWTA